jgi:hypothetical protein
MSHSTNIHSGIVNQASPLNAKEMQDKQDFVSLDIPLLIRVLELVREDIIKAEEYFNLASNYDFKYMNSREGKFVSNNDIEEAFIAAMSNEKMTVEVEIQA